MLWLTVRTSWSSTKNRTYPAVHSAHVVGVPDAARGENVAAFVVLRPGAVKIPDDTMEA